MTIKVFQRVLKEFFGLVCVYHKKSFDLPTGPLGLKASGLIQAEYECTLYNCYVGRVSQDSYNSYKGSNIDCG